MTSKLPTDPLADASTGVVRRSRGAFLKTVPEKRPDRRNPNRKGNYTGPERRTSDSKAAKPIFGLPRWMVIAGGVYLAALALALVLVFTY